MEVALQARAGRRDAGCTAELPYPAAGSEALSLDASRVQGVEPLFAARLHMCIEHYQRLGGEVKVEMPTDPATRRALEQMRVGQPVPRGAEGVPAAPTGDVILPLVRIEILDDVDPVAEALFPLLLDHFDDVALIRDAVLMAIGELCQNSAEHGENPLGCVVAARRFVHRDQRRLALAVADLGIGIPEHLRRQYPECTVDEHAIGMAMEAGVTGTQRTDRGQGFAWVLNETLASGATAAEMIIRSGSGVFRRKLVDGSTQDHGHPAPQVRGTWIAHDWISVR